MILTDLLSEYEYIYELLKSSKDYFSKSERLFVTFFNESSSAICSHSSTNSSNDSKALLQEFESIFENLYNIICSMLVSSFSLHKAIVKLEDYTFVNPALNEEIQKFVSWFSIVTDATNRIVLEKESGLITKGLLPELIYPLYQLMHYYHILQHYYYQFSTLDKTLFENIPNIDSESDEYNRIELHSLKPSLNMDSFIDDLKNLSSFIAQFELIMTPENGSCKVYTQRIESGSLRIVWGSNTIELSGISDIIRAISDGIRMFRLTTPEKRLKDEKARTLKLQNDEKELAIINSQIASVARITGLSSEKPEDIEKLQKLCLPLVRYLYSNPVGVIGDYSYNFDNELKLIESAYKIKYTL